MTPDQITIQLPLRDFSDRVSRAVKALPSDDRPRPDSYWLSRAMLDLGRTEYVRIASEELGVVEGYDSVPLLLDLTRTRAIGYGVLPMLGALIKYRHDKKYSTRLLLPTDPVDGRDVNPVIDYMRTWRFGEFVETITGMASQDTTNLGVSGFTAFLDERCVKAWTDWTPEQSTYSRTARDGANQVQVLSSKHAALTEIARPPANGDSSADVQRDQAGLAIASTIAKWTTGTLGSLLKYRIRNRQGQPDADIVANTILNELLVNSLIHPGRARVFTCGQFTSAPVGGRSYFVLSVWDGADDESSLSAKLRAAANRDVIQSPAFGHVRENFVVWDGNRFMRQIDPNEGSAKQHLTKMSDAPHMAMVAGVTSDPDTLTAPPDEGIGDIPADYQGFAGMGLYRVRIATIRALDGFIEYSGSDQRMRMRQASREELEAQSFAGKNGNPISQADSYRVDIRSSKRDCWPLAGDLWAAWLPVTDDPSRQGTD